MKHRQAVFAAAIVLLAGLAVWLVGPASRGARHYLSGHFISEGSKSQGSAKLFWYQLAHTVSPGDPAVGLSLAEAEVAAGRSAAAVKVLEHYSSNQTDSTLAAKLLVQEGKFDQAISAMSRIGQPSMDGAYWLAAAQAEQGNTGQAITTLAPDRISGDALAEELRSLLQLAAGQIVNGPVSSSKAAQDIADAQTGVLPLALIFYRLGLYNTSERVLINGHQTSAAAWTLRAAIATDKPAPNLPDEENDYWQALLQDPTNQSVKKNLVALATDLKDNEMLAKVSQLQSQLPTR